MEDIDLSAWMGKPPAQAQPPADIAEGSEDEEAVQPQLPLDPEPPREPAEASDSDGSSESGDILHEDSITAPSLIRAQHPRESLPDDSDLEEDDRPRNNSSSVLRKQNFYIDLPILSAEEKAQYEYLPGHFSVRKILLRHSTDKFIVKLGSGERTLVSLAVRHYIRAC